MSTNNPDDSNCTCSGMPTHRKGQLGRIFPPSPVVQKGVAITLSAAFLYFSHGVTVPSPYDLYLLAISVRYRFPQHTAIHIYRSPKRRQVDTAAITDAEQDEQTGDAKGGA